jgi:hypothetical protein
MKLQMCFEVHPFSPLVYSVGRLKSFAAFHHAAPLSITAFLLLAPFLYPCEMFSMHIGGAYTTCTKMSLLPSLPDI